MSEQNNAENSGIGGGIKNAYKEKSQSLVIHLLFFVGLFIIFFNVLQILAMGQITKDEQLKDAAGDYSVIVSAYAHSIENKIETYFSSLDYYINSDAAASGDLIAMREWLVAHEDKRPKVFDYIMLCGPDGIAYTDTGKRTEISDRPYFKAIMKDGNEKFIDDPAISKTTGNAVVHVTRAIINNGKSIGFFSGVVNIEGVADSIASIKVGETGYAVVLDSDGTVISHPNKDWVMKRNFLTGYSKGHEDMGQLAARMVNGEKGSAWVKGINDKLEFVCFTNIRGTDWSIAILVNQGEIYSTIYFIIKQMIGASLICVILLLPITGFIMSRSIKPLKVLEKAITGIASGNADLTKRIDLNSKNEIGAVVKGFKSL